MRTGLLLAVTMVLLAIVPGCYTPAVISPEPLAAGDFCGGFNAVGYLMPKYDQKGLDAGPYCRVGFGAGIDAGLRFSLLNGPCADLKWNIISQPFLLTVDVGGSYIKTHRDDLTEHFTTDTAYAAVYPGLFVGTSTLFGGVRLMIQRGFGDNGYNGGPAWWGLAPALSVGASFGDRFRFLPAFDMVFSPGKPFFTLGIAVEGHTRLRAAEQNFW